MFRSAGAGFILVILLALSGISVGLAKAESPNPSEEILALSTDEAGPASKIVVTVADNDLNVYGASQDRAMGLVTVFSDRDESKSADLYIDETGRNTGIFTGTISLVPSLVSGSRNSGSNNVTINVMPGDILSITYIDLKGADGTRGTITKTVRVVASDPDMNMSVDGYLEGKVQVNIYDIDADRDSSTIDTLPLKVISSSTGAQMWVTAFETGVNSKRFEAIFSFSAEPVPGTLTTSDCSAIMFVEYTDNFPADFASKFRESNDLTNVSKQFQISGGWIAGCISPARPELRIIDTDGSDLNESTRNSPISISTNVTNVSTKDQSMTVVFEVRNQGGITMQITWASAVIPAGEKYSFNTTWIPEAAGPYEIRSFVLRSLEKPEILSEVISTELTVR